MAVTTNIYETIANYLGVSVNVAIAIVVIISVWSLVWKGLALWKSARKTHLVWFIVLLVVNTVGILEILYIYIFSEMRKGKTKAPKPKPIPEKPKKK